METQEQVEIHAALDRFRDLLWARDLAILDEFWDDPGSLLIGSDADEVARGPAAIGALLRQLFALPVRLRWEWHSRSVSVSGDLAWFFTECEVVAATEASDVRKPYRMSGVLQRASGQWKWRQFHGSEPNPAAEAAAPH